MGERRFGKQRFAPKVLVTSIEAAVVDQAIESQEHRIKTAGGHFQVRWDENGTASALGQLAFFAEFLEESGLFERWVQSCPLFYTSPNAPGVQDILGTWLLSMGRLTALATRLPHIDADQRLAAINSLSEEDRTTWEIMHHRSGHRLSVRFGHETLSIPLPTLNRYTIEPYIRSISARVSAIDAKSYQLISIRDIKRSCDCVDLPTSMKMDRPRNVDNSVRRSRFLLHVAEEANVRVTLLVRVVLWQSNLSPAYLEFRGIEEDAVLLRAQSLLHLDNQPSGVAFETRPSPSSLLIL